MKFAALILLVMMLAGCSGTAAVLRALAKDEASTCVSVQSPYASFAIGRANRAGVEVNVSGGACTMKHSALEDGP